MRRLVHDIGRGLYKLFVGILIASLVGAAAYATNYTVTQGSGTTFGSIVVATVNYAQQLVCDPTTPTQCLGINSSGQATVVVANASTDPCVNAKTNLAISFQTTSITQLIALSGSTKIYVCSLSLVASGATVFSLTGGTGTNCGTPAAMIGTTSATHGLSLPANGGMTYGSGIGTVASTGAGSELCIVQSGAGDLVGNLTYVQQ